MKEQRELRMLVVLEEGGEYEIIKEESGSYKELNNLKIMEEN